MISLKLTSCFVSTNHSGYYDKNYPIINTMQNIRPTVEGNGQIWLPNSAREIPQAELVALSQAAKDGDGNKRCFFPEVICVTNFLRSRYKGAYRSAGHTHMYSEW